LRVVSGHVLVDEGEDEEVTDGWQQVDRGNHGQEAPLDRGERRGIGVSSKDILGPRARPAGHVRHEVGQVDQRGVDFHA